MEHKRCAVRVGAGDQTDVCWKTAWTVGEKDKVAGGGCARRRERAVVACERVYACSVVHLGRERVAGVGEGRKYQRSAARSVVDAVEDDGVSTDERRGGLYCAEDIAARSRRREG